MGALGTAVFADDVAVDVRDQYLSLLAEGATDKRALETMLHDWSDSIANSDDGPIFRLALAATQWEYGRLNAKVKARALRVIDKGEGFERWSGSAEEKRRFQVLQRLKAKLQSQQPKRRTPRKRLTPEPECIAVWSPDRALKATAVQLSGPGEPRGPLSQVSVQSGKGVLSSGVFCAYCEHTEIRLK